jgi:hypothetical protein
MGCLILHQGMPSEPYRNEVPQRHHRDPPSSGLGYRPRVLRDQHGCGCGKFGTKRPQVQMLSPRPVFSHQRPSPQISRQPTSPGHDRPVLLTEMPGPRKAELRRGGRTRCPPERARTAARRHLERPSSPPHNPACSSGSSKSSCGLFGSSPTTSITRQPVAPGPRQICYYA